MKLATMFLLLLFACFGATAGTVPSATGVWLDPATSGTYYQITEFTQNRIAKAVVTEVFNGAFTQQAAHGTLFDSWGFGEFKALNGNLGGVQVSPVPPVVWLTFHSLTCDTIVVEKLNGAGEVVYSSTLERITPDGC